MGDAACSALSSATCDPPPAQHGLAVAFPAPATLAAGLRSSGAARPPRRPSTSARCPRPRAGWRSATRGSRPPRLIQPFAAAASTMAYSPETLYAATGTSTASATSPQHVEVAHGRLDHHHVRALGDVEKRLAHTFEAVGRILLVGPPVALERGVHGLAEGAVEGGGVLGGVGKDRHVLVAGGVEPPGPRRPGRPSSRSDRRCRPRRWPGRRAMSAYDSSVRRCRPRRRRSARRSARGR